MFLVAVFVVIESDNWENKYISETEENKIFKSSSLHLYQKNIFFRK